MELEKLEHDLMQVNSNKEALKKNYLELIELRHVLLKASAFFEEVSTNKEFFFYCFFFFFTVQIKKELQFDYLK